jgi:hypothetical protein
MRPKILRILVIVLVAASMSGCAALRSSRKLSRPTLEGGQMYVVSSEEPAKPTELEAKDDGKAGSRKKKEDAAAPLLSELSKIDLIYELDPKRYGSCHPRVRPELTSPVEDRDARMWMPETSPYDYLPAEARTAAAKLRCALDGFYSSRYFGDLSAGQKEALEVSNVAFAYAEKQSARVTELAKPLNGQPSSTSPNEKFYSDTRDQIQKKVVELQISDLTSRVNRAQVAAPFLEFQRRRRNQVQSSFMAASDAACDYYKRNLNRDFSRSNFFFGSLATLAGGLGAILTDEGTSRALAGASGITSGIRAEYNDAFFRNKVVELLTKAIDIAQTRKREEIRRRGVQITADYSMEDALNDAVLYNAQCSLIAGLQETSESLQIVSDPGLKWLANAFGGAASKGELTTKLFESLGQAVSTVQQVQKQMEDQNAPDLPKAPSPAPAAGK